MCLPSSPSSPGPQRAISAPCACWASWPGASRWPSRPSTPRRGWAFPSASITTRARRGESSSTSAMCRSSTPCRFRSSPMPPSASRGRVLGPVGRGRITLLAGVLMMLLDVVIDPLAVRGDRWFLGRIFYYAEAGVYFGVPLSNFAGWLVVGWVTVGGYLAVTGKTDRPGRPEPGRRPLLWSAAVQPGDHLVDRRNGSPGDGNPDSCRDLSATLYSRWRHQSPSGVGGRKRSLMSVPVSQMFTVASVCDQAEAPRTKAVSARPHARAALPVQPRLRGLRQDPVPRPGAQEAPHGGAVRQGRRGVWRPDGEHPGRRAAACIPRSTGSWPSW